MKTIYTQPQKNYQDNKEERDWLKDQLTANYRKHLKNQI